MITPAPAGLDNMTYLVTFFTHHTILVLFPIWNIVVDGIVTTGGAILRTMLFVNLMGIPVAMVNWLIGSNYMHLCTKQGGATGRFSLATGRGTCSDWRSSPCC